MEENVSNTERTLGDLTPGELIELALIRLSALIAQHEADEPGDACGAYAYLHLAKSKLDGGE